jgi:hypothetical protein
VQVGFGVAASLVSFVVANDWNVVVDYEFNLWDIDTPCKQICSNESAHFALSKLSHHFVSLGVIHVTEHDSRRAPFTFENIAKSFNEIFRVYENDALSH